jgi:ABC-type multidrug transport system ATPase subunit
MIRVRALRVRAPNGSTRLHVPHLEFPAGTVTAILGPSGCGKSTLLRALGLLEDAEATEHMVNSVDALRTPALARRSVGFVPEHAMDVGDVSVVDHLGLHAALCGAPVGTVEGALELTDLEGVALRSTRALSPGERKRLALARVLLQDPAVLLLDEPCSTLDTPGRRDLRVLCAELAGLGRTVLLSARVASDLGGLGHRKVLLDRGGVVDQSARVCP